MKRLLTIVLLIALAVSATADARTFWFGHEGLGHGKLGAAGSQGSNGAPPATCGTGVIDLSTGCTLPIALGLVP